MSMIPASERGPSLGEAASAAEPLALVWGGKEKGPQAEETPDQVSGYYSVYGPSLALKNPLRIMSTPARRRLMRDFKRYRNVSAQFFLPVLGANGVSIRS